MTSERPDPCEIKTPHEMHGLHDFRPGGYGIDCPGVKTKRERETAKRRELGLCIICGKPSAPKATCPDCGKRANAHKKARSS